MLFIKKENTLTAKQNNETLTVEAWGNNALRVRSTQNSRFSGENHALSLAEKGDAEISVREHFAEIKNGKISCVISECGAIEFFKDGLPVLKEYSRDWRGNNEHSGCMKFSARTFKPVSGNDYDITMRFEADSSEKIYGMGQYQQPQLDLKGCILELAQRNSQISIPFYLSNKGYGFLWNNEGIGEVMFGTNYTQWHSVLSEELDYWITADDTPKQIIENYTDVTGRAPEFPYNALGLWQCKLRYRTQQELLEVAREYKKRNIPLDVIVIDFFHWVRQGDWSFDPKYWPDPQECVPILQFTISGTTIRTSIFY
ncbi:MAG: hypothetical protein NC452_08910 [Eubacterium sp.]|nr:hypothetical protein [Eubacterium sp.]